MVTMVTLVIIKILTLFNNPIYTGNYGNLGNSSFGGGWVGGGVGVGCCMLGWSDEQDVHNYGNLGN